MGKTLVIGTGKSGIKAADLLYKMGETPVLFDSNEKLNIDEIRGRLEESTRGIDIFIKEIPANIANSITRLVLSPGVPIDSPMVCEYRDRGAEISGEIELAYSYEEGDLLAITGTNGKTTTTALLGKIMEDYNGNTFVVGNIGNPYTACVIESSPDSVSVAEISSFQLETIHNFHPKVSAILNITPDHLNRHHTMEQYILEKEKIAVNQTREDYVILNYEDEVLREFADKTSATPVMFSSRRELDKGFFLRDNAIYMNDPLNDNMECVRLIGADELNIIGEHNLENAMAAIAMAHVYGVPMCSILASTREFKAVEHRIEFVANKNDVVYYNDSKGTNVDAAIKGIQAMNRKTVLIGGGYDKGADFTEWIESFNGKVKKLVLIGQTAQIIAKCCDKCGFSDYEFCDTFEEAVNRCHELAEPGEAVLLSPACASWGMFDNYEQRGNIFKELVGKL